MTGDFIKIVGICLISATLVLVIKQHNPEIAFAASIGVGIVTLIFIVNMASDAIIQVKALSSILDSSGFEYVVKALGISILTNTAAETCRDSHESAMAVKIEFAGQVTILACCIPMMRQVLELVAGLVDL
ncbi:MAG: SpoIIIAC/SpoIIIAD family protein [Oscillospiraceae bacterium]